MSNLSAPLPVMAGEDMPAGPTDPIFNRLLKDRIIWMGEEVMTRWPTAFARRC